MSSGNLVLHVRIGIYETVENDGNLLADVVAGKTGPGVRTFGVH